MLKCIILVNKSLGAFQSDAQDHAILNKSWSMLKESKSSALWRERPAHMRLMVAKNIGLLKLSASIRRTYSDIRVLYLFSPSPCFSLEIIQSHSRLTCQQAYLLASNLSIITCGPSPRVRLSTPSNPLCLIVTVSSWCPTNKFLSWEKWVMNSRQTSLILMRTTSQHGAAWAKEFQEWPLPSIRTLLSLMKLAKLSSTLTTLNATCKYKMSVSLLNKSWSWQQGRIPSDIPTFWHTMNNQVSPRGPLLLSPATWLLTLRQFQSSHLLQERRRVNRSLGAQKIFSCCKTSKLRLQGAISKTDTSLSFAVATPGAPAAPAFPTLESHWPSPQLWILSAGSHPNPISSQPFGRRPPYSSRPMLDMPVFIIEIYYCITFISLKSDLTTYNIIIITWDANRWRLVSEQPDAQMSVS